ncbi:hypothetical protein ACMFMG_002054 [Clarireedia jacksonii]
MRIDGGSANNQTLAAQQISAVGAEPKQSSRYVHVPSSDGNAKCQRPSQAFTFGNPKLAAEPSHRSKMHCTAQRAKRPATSLHLDLSPFTTPHVPRDASFWLTVSCSVIGDILPTTHHPSAVP